MVAKGPIKEQYKALGLSCAATELDVKEAYLRLARQHHPDHNYGDPEATERFKEVQVAYEALCRHFAKPKPKARPRRSDQSPFVVQDSSRPPFLDAWSITGCLLLVVSLSFWWLTQEQRQVASSDSSAAITKTPAFAFGKSSDETTNPAQPGGVSERPLKGNTGYRKSSASLELAGPIEVASSAATDTPNDGVTQTSDETEIAGPLSTRNPKQEPVTRLPPEKYGNSYQVEIGELELSDWPPAVSDAPLASIESHTLIDSTTDRDLSDPQVWYGLLNSKQPSYSIKPPQSEPSRNSGSGKRSFEAKTGSSFSNVTSGSPWSSHMAKNDALDFNFEAQKQFSRSSTLFGKNSSSDSVIDLPGNELDILEERKPKAAESYGGIEISSESRHSSRTGRTFTQWKPNRLWDPPTTPSHSPVDHLPIIGPNIEGRRSSGPKSVSLPGETNRPVEKYAIPSIPRASPENWAKFGSNHITTGNTRSYEPNRQNGTANWQSQSKSNYSSESSTKVLRSHDQLGARIQKPSDWMSHANRVEVHKTTLQPYSSKAPSSGYSGAASRTVRPTGAFKTGPNASSANYGL